MYEVYASCINKEQKHHFSMMQAAVPAGVTCITGAEFTPTTSPALVLFAQQPAAGIPSRFTEPPPSFSGPEKQKGRNPIVCDQCGYTCYRSTDIKDYMLSHSGQLPTCKIGDCKNMNEGEGRSFKFGKNLKANVKTKHEGVYHCNCTSCDYAADNKGYFKTHGVKHHREELEQEFICNDCGKTLYGQPFLKRHQRHGRCTTLNNFTYQICVPNKGYKSHVSLVIHIERFHTGEIPLVPYPKCHKDFASNESLKAHNIIHVGLELLKKAKRNRLRIKQNLTAKRFAKEKPGKSAAAKLIPYKSPHLNPI